MDPLKQIKSQLSARLMGLITLLAVLILVSYLLLAAYTNLSKPIDLLTTGLIAITGAYLITWHVVRLTSAPLTMLANAIEHVSQDKNVAAPIPENLRYGRELVATLAHQVYQLASNVGSGRENAKLKPNPVADSFSRHLPLPTLGVDKNSNIVFINSVGENYFDSQAQDLIGKNLYSAIDMSFQNEKTFDDWLKSCRLSKVTDVNTWERVRLKSTDLKSVKQFDLAAAYSKEDPSGLETILVFFDHTNRYNNDDQSFGFIALAVHELRTPLTALRGYIEVFEEELAGKLTPELSDFMNKMHVSSEALAAFVSNILNVARIEGNQLELHLDKEDWPQILTSIIDEQKLQAQVHNKTLELNISLGIPPVAVDRISIREVVSNLIDNAIKYSGSGPKKIIVRSGVNQGGLIETTVQDFGVGIPTALTANLFDKFYRSHRSRAEIGGTGLGLYLSKAIVNAHGGNIWVRSQEGAGSTFGFTLVPYGQLAEELKSSDNKDITRSAHGWIKNHSMYRR